jgi:cytochrome c oxidase subunit III
MGATVTHEHALLDGGPGPMGATYGKMMMWFFIVSDALTFSGFIAAYGFSRFKFIETWPIADQVFTHFPFLHGVHAPMYYVALMTFILIFSSVTMVLAVDAGHQMKKQKVAVYMLLTIVGGFAFLGSQAWEWKNFIKGENGALETAGGSVLQFVEEGKDGHFHSVPLANFAAELPEEREQLSREKGVWFMKESEISKHSVAEVTEGFMNNKNLRIRTELINKEKEKTVLSREESEKRIKDAVLVVEGANLVRNEYGHKLFADFFFFITGFHGFHVFSGVMLNVLIFFNVVLGTYERRGSYEMVEKVGLYWHFVDLVWVFVFTFFYLV